MTRQEIEKELTVRRTIIEGYRHTEVEIYNTPITPKENMLRYFRHERPMWIDMQYNNICPPIVPDNVARAIVSDVKPFNPDKEAGGPDWFGVQWLYQPENRGSMVVPGAPMIDDITEWENVIRFPDLDALDWEGESKRLESLYDPEQMTISTIFTGFFERLISMMDFEDAAIALIDEDEQEGVHRLFDALADFYIALTDKLQKWFRIDVLELHDDWGSQRSPFFSREVCEEMILPYLKRVVDACHERGLFFSFHSCGMIEPLVPVMIEAGVDTWGGQSMNDKWKLYDLYGDKLIFNVRDEAPPAATPEEAAEKVASWMAHMRPDRNIFIATRDPLARRELYIQSRLFLEQ